MKSKTEAYIALGQLTEQLYGIEAEINAAKQDVGEKIKEFEARGTALTAEFKSVLAALSDMPDSE